MFLKRQYARGAALSAAASLLGTACVLLTDLDGLDANRGRDGSDAASSASTDGATTAMSDPADGSDAMAACPVGAFCQDFDTSTAAADGFDRSDIAPSAALRLRRDVFRSPGQSLRVELTATNDYAYCVVKKEWSTGLTRGSLRTNLWLDRLSPDRTFTLLGFKRYDDTLYSELMVEVSKSTISLREERDGVSSSAERPFSWRATSWFALRVDFDVVAKTATVSVDGTVVIDAVPLTGRYNEPSTLIQLGALGNSGTSGFVVSYDDVVYDVR